MIVFHHVLQNDAVLVDHAVIRTTARLPGQTDRDFLKSALPFKIYVGQCPRHGIDDVRVSP